MVLNYGPLQGYNARLMHSLLNSARMDPEGFLRAYNLETVSTLEFGCVTSPMNPMR